MTEPEAFLAQARSDYQVFLRLAGVPRHEIEECHPLHYLQMATEKLAKAAFLRLQIPGFDKYSHVTFDRLRNAKSQPDISDALGWRSFSDYVDFLKRAAPMFRQLVEVHPGVGPQRAGGGSKEGPNVEYPWRGRDARGKALYHAPCQYRFGILDRLQSHGDYARFRLLLTNLMERFDTVFAQR